MKFIKYTLQILTLTGTIFLCFWAIKPLIAEIYMSQADIYVEKKMYYVAFDLYKKGLDFDSLNSLLHQKIALIYLDLAFIENNKDYVKKGIDELLMAKNLSGDPRVDYRLALAYELLGSVDKASYYFKRAYKRSAGNIAAEEIKNYN